MQLTLLIELALNGLQFGLMLFLLAAGLTLVFGIMDFINLAHGSLYMLGAYFAASFVMATDSFWLGLVLAVAATMVAGVILELLVFRRLYQRSHMSQVLATFALILIFNEGARMVWGEQPLRLNTPEVLSQPVEILPGFYYSSFRLFIIATGLAVDGAPQSSPVGPAPEINLRCPAPVLAAIDRTLAMTAPRHQRRLPIT